MIKSTLLSALGLALNLMSTPVESATYALSEQDAMARFKLAERLETYGAGGQLARAERLIEVVQGDLQVSGDLLVDGSRAREQVEQLRQRSPGDRNANTLRGSSGLIVTGNLEVSGAIINANLNGGPFLLVLGTTRARALFAGGAEFRFEGHAQFSDAVVGCYNDGYTRFAGGVQAPVVLSEDHAFDIQGVPQAPFFDYFNGDGDLDELASLLDPDIGIEDLSELDAETDLLPRIRRAEPIARVAAIGADSPRD
jgi:hypothetical protein